MIKKRNVRHLRFNNNFPYVYCNCCCPIIHIIHIVYEIFNATSVNTVYYVCYVLQEVIYMAEQRLLGQLVILYNRLLLYHVIITYYSLIELYMGRAFKLILDGLRFQILE